MVRFTDAKALPLRFIFSSSIFTMIIAPNKVVSVHYTLTEGTAEGNLVETTNGGEPMAFIYGVGSMIPDFEKNLDTEKALEGLKKNTRAGSIVVFHDSVKSEKNLKAMLPLYLQFLNEKGFNCKAL